MKLDLDDIKAKAEANAILNEFAGWKPGQNKVTGYIPPIDYFADTPEAREALRLLKDEFVRKVGGVSVRTARLETGELVYAVTWGHRSKSDFAPTESHAIAFALAAALKERGE